MNLVNEILDGNTSDFDLSDGEDDEDTDPTFISPHEGGIQPEDVHEEMSDAEGQGVSDGEEQEQGGVSEDQSDEATTIPRPLFWKRTESFIPLPRAPPFESPEEHPLNQQPYDFFTTYIPTDLFEKFAFSTNQRYLQEKGHSLGVTPTEMKTFFGITMMMSCLKYPRIKMFWANATRIHLVADHMSRNRYFEIRNNLKIVDDLSITDDQKKFKFWKLEPLIKAVRTACLLNSRSENICIDEQMIPFHGQHDCRQFVRNKPNPVGLKNFVMCAPDGLPLDFFIYEGKGNEIINDPECNNLDLGGKVVMRLTETLPPGCTIYMDRYFSSVPLLDLLHFKRECTGTGILQKNRVPLNSNLVPDNELAKQCRGSHSQSVRSDGQICLVKSLDNKPITTVSSCESANPLTTCIRWSKKDREYIQIPRPNLIDKYNANMGGVDFLDRMMSYYRMSHRSRKWTVRTIMHMMDFAVAAGWIMYRRQMVAMETPRNKIMDILDFKISIKNELIYRVPVPEKTDPDSDFEPRPKKSRARVQQPPAALRLNQVGHLPEIPTPATKNRCRYPGCKSNVARIRCVKCNVFLCVNEERNCFKLYHTITNPTNEKRQPKDPILEGEREQKRSVKSKGSHTSSLVFL